MSDFILGVGVGWFFGCVAMFVSLGVSGGLRTRREFNKAKGIEE